MKLSLRAEPPGRRHPARHGEVKPQVADRLAKQATSRSATIDTVAGSLDAGHAQKSTTKLRTRDRLLGPGKGSIEQLISRAVRCYVDEYGYHDE